MRFLSTMKRNRLASDQTLQPMGSPAYCHISSRFMSKYVLEKIRQSIVKIVWELKS